ncbi:MAG TPA: sigma-70 family RNA polymerase sigma factor [Verrucomicrobiae bacterium]|nr:sigma-70 family RNA polymerase sigma factor [Verrucomicrobiae bacterium]
MNDSANPPDLAALLAATARGDQAAFAELYAATSSHLFAVLLRMLQRRDWAEEALQDAYMRIWQKSEGYDPARGVPMAWMSTIARYRALDLLRMRRPEINESQFDEEARPLLDAPDESSGPEDRAVAGAGLDHLERCMKGLSDEQRRSVLLAYYEGYTHTELARRMKAPMGTVKSWVRRGLLQLRDCLGAAT